MKTCDISEASDRADGLDGPQGTQAPRGKLAQVVDCGFHPPRGAPYPLPQLPLTPGWSQPCLFPSRHPFYDGEGWFSPNPADTSPLCLSLTLPPWEAPCWPPEMSQQDGAPATHAASQMGPKRGSGSPTVTRTRPAQDPGSCLLDVPPQSWEAGGGSDHPFHISHEKTGAPGEA